MSRRSQSEPDHDLVVVGGGIVGLAASILAARAGARVVLLEADSAARGASVRNFGLITISGQSRGEVWRLSGRSRDIWEAVAREAGLPILQRGMMIAAQSTEASQVLTGFLATEMGADCIELPLAEAAARVPALRAGKVQTAAWSPRELRVDPRQALPALKALAQNLGVDLRFGAPVSAVGAGTVRLFSGEVMAARQILVCTGAQLGRLAPPELSRAFPGCTKLHMLRVRPRVDAGELSAPLVSDLTLARYPGFADLPEARELKSRLIETDPEMLADGIHVIAVRNADGTITLGDSHHDCHGDTADPFQPADVDQRILEAAGRFIDLEGADVVERWTGTYPKAEGADWLIEQTEPGVWFAGVLGGKGMTLSFGFAEMVLQRLGLETGAIA